MVGSVLVVRSLQHALSLNLGFEPRHAATVSFDLGLQGYDETRGREFQRRVLERVRALPGIESAGLIDGLPLSLNWNNSGVFIEGKPAPRAADTPLAAIFTISPGYLHAAQTKLMDGPRFYRQRQEGRAGASRSLTRRSRNNCCQAKIRSASVSATIRPKANGGKSSA